MKWRIISVGKPAHAWAWEGVEMYLERMRAWGGVEWTALRRGDEASFAEASGDRMTIALDERGVHWSTAELAARVREWEQAGVKGVAVWIGGAEGLGDALRARADLVLSLGRLTLMHELALLVWMEQLYRVGCLLRGHPYHRA